MRFIDHEEKIFREKVEESERLRPGRAARKVSRIIFDPTAKAHLLQHLEIIFRAHFQALRFEQSPLRLELHDPLVELGPNRPEGAVQLVSRRDELFRRKKSHHA